MNPQDKKPPQKGRGKTGARRAAATMLAAIERGKSLDEARDKLVDLSDSDRNLADAIVQATLRHYGEIDALLRHHVKKMPPHSSLARPLLAIGTAQLIYMNVPSHAALHETVSATGRREQPYRGLINAVLRNVARAQEADKLPAPDPLLNLPEWLKENWLDFYGAEKTAAIAASLADAPMLDLCFKSAAAAESWLAQHGAQYKGEAVSPTHIRLHDSSDVTALAGFTEGDFWVQNAAAGQPAAQLIAQISAPAHVLDICAAPGGKTLQLAAAGHRVTALDISKSRLQRLAENLTRTQLHPQLDATVCADALDWTPPDPFDAILLDAPCTATGTLRRHPDVLRHRKLGQMTKLVTLQAALLARAADWLKPNGVLAYSVCALQPQEGEAQMATFLESRADFTRLTTDAPSRFTPDENMDGFFIALLRKGR
jgi:16S rRNA (cytosine967-C5)-methyltransferase